VGAPLKACFEDNLPKKKMQILKPYDRITDSEFLKVETSTSFSTFYMYMNCLESLLKMYLLSQEAEGYDMS
jgi:hypothetical protein